MKGGSHNDEEVAGEHATGMIVEGLQAAEEAKEISVPPHQRVGTHDRQELTPFDKSRQEYECNARGIVSPTRSDLAFDVTRELLAEEEVLGGQLCAGPEYEPQQAHQVSEEGERRLEQVGSSYRQQITCVRLRLIICGGHPKADVSTPHPTAFWAGPELGYPFRSPRCEPVVLSAAVIVSGGHGLARNVPHDSGRKCSVHTV